MGFFSAVTLIITWTLNNQASASGKGMGKFNSLGVCGSYFLCFYAIAGIEDTISVGMSFCRNMLIIIKTTQWE
jgi:hypothetical protein